MDTETPISETTVEPYRWPDVETQLECAGLGVAAALSLIAGMVILHFARKALQAGDSFYD